MPQSKNIMGDTYTAPQGEAQSADLIRKRGRNAASFSKAGMFATPQDERNYISRQGRREAKKKPMLVNSQGNTSGESLGLGLLGKVH